MSSDDHLTRTKKALMADLLRSGIPVRFRAMGRSMSPTIGHKEVVTVAPTHHADLRPGDVVLYERGQRIFAHRLVAVVRHDDDNGEVRFLLRGDNQLECDRPVGPSAILGKLVEVHRFWGPVSLDDAPRGTA
jgi:hypothetical protein